MRLWYSGTQPRASELSELGSESKGIISLH